jgi:plasmid maintenance system antidote protein VapI
MRPFTKEISMPRHHQAISPEEMREELRKWVRDHETLTASADHLGVAAGHLSEMISGQRSISDHVAAQLGFTKVRESKKITVVYYVGSK